MSPESGSSEQSPQIPIADLINRLCTASRNSDVDDTEKEIIYREEKLNKRISDLKEISSVLESALLLKYREVSELERELSGSKEAEAEAKQRYERVVEYSRLLEKQEEAVRAEFEEEKVAFAAELRSLRGRLADKEEELGELRLRAAEEADNKEAMRTRFEEEMEELAAELSSFRGRLAYKEEELGKLRQRAAEELESKEAMRTRFEEEKEESAAELGSLRGRLADKEEELGELRRRATEEVENKEAMWTRFEEEKEELAAELNSLRGRLANKEEELGELRRRATEEVESKEAMRTHFEDAKGELSAELSSLRGRLADKEDELGELSRRAAEELENKEAIRARFEEEKEGLAAELSSLWGSLADKEEELGELRQRATEELENQEAMRTRFEDKKIELSAELSSLLGRLADKEEELGELRRRATEEVEIKEATRKQFEEEKEELAAELSSLRGRLADKEEELGELRLGAAEKLEKQETAARAMFEEEKAKFGAEMSSLQRRLAEKEMSCRNAGQLERKLGEKKVKIRELVKKLEELEWKNKEDFERRYKEVFHVAKMKDREIEKLDKEKEALKLENSELSARLSKIESCLKVDEDLAALYLDVGKDVKCLHSKVREVLSGNLNEFESREDCINGMTKDVGNVCETAQTGSEQPSEIGGGGAVDGLSVQLTEPINNESGPASDGGGVGEGSLLQPTELETRDSGLPSDGGRMLAAPASRHEAQKRVDWNDFVKFLSNRKPALFPSSCSGAHVVEFLKSLNQFEKTKEYGCMNCGSIALCSCSIEQKWHVLDALIARLGAAYEENGGHRETNPFRAPAVQSYLQEARKSEAKGHRKPCKKKRRRPSTDNPAAAEAGGSHNFRNSISGLAESECHGMDLGECETKRRIKAEQVNHIENQVDGTEGSTRSEFHLTAEDIQVQPCEEENTQHLPLYDEVIQQGGNKWSCKHCNLPFSSSYTGMHYHFFGAPVGQSLVIQRCMTLSSNREELDRIRKKVEDAEKFCTPPSLSIHHTEAKHWDHRRNLGDGTEASACPQSHPTSEDDQFLSDNEEKNKQEAPLYDEVIRQGGNKWICRHCKQSFTSSYTRIRIHFLGPPVGQRANIRRCPAILANSEELCRIQKKSDRRRS